MVYDLGMGMLQTQATLQVLGKFHVGHSLAPGISCISHRSRIELSAERAANPWSKCIIPFFLYAHAFKGT